MRRSGSSITSTSIDRSNMVARRPWWSIWPLLVVGAALSSWPQRHCVVTGAGILDGRKSINGLLGSRKNRAIEKTPPPPRAKDTEIAIKTGLLSSSVEAAALVAILQGSLLITARSTTNKWNPMVWKLPVVQWLAVLVVVWGSAGVRSGLDGTVQAAAQTLRPTITPGDPKWYSSLRKPWFNPPAWLFPIMWLIISKPTQVLALRSLLLHCCAGNNNDGSTSHCCWLPLIPYGLHLALGDTWNQVFFNHQRIGLGSIIIGAFWSTLLVAIYLFDSVTPSAGYFLLPTATWVTVAALLNLEIYRLNQYVPPPPPPLPPSLARRLLPWRLK
jgi:translocator protein